MAVEDAGVSEVQWGVEVRGHMTMDWIHWLELQRTDYFD